MAGWRPVRLEISDQPATCADDLSAPARIPAGPVYVTAG
jgi:hypothetical protein